MKNKNKILLFLLVVFFTGCSHMSSAKKDLFSDMAYREKVLLAAKNYKDLIQTLKDKLAQKDTSSVRIKLAGYYYESGDYDSVFYYLSPLIQTNQYPEAMFLWAKTLQMVGKNDEALLMIDKVLNKDNKMAEAYNLKGIIYSNKKEFKHAEENFLEAKRMFLSDAIVNTNLAMLKILEKKYTEAINYLMALYTRGYKDSKIVHNLIFALTKNRNFKLALEIVEKENLSDSPREFIRNLYAIKDRT